MDIFEKQPADVVDINIDLSQYLPSTDSIVNAVPTFEGTNDGSLVLGTTAINNTTKVVTQWVSGGTDGKSYHVAVTITSAAGRVKQVDFKVKVKEI
jgi:hypothetical protein